MTPAPRAALLALLAAALLAGCAPQRSAPPLGTAGTPRVSAAQAAACRQRADEVHDRQNRADVYRSDIYAGGTRDAMFSGTGSPGTGGVGLSSRFARDRMLADCLRGVGQATATDGDTPAPRRPAP